MNPITTQLNQSELDDARRRIAALTAGLEIAEHLANLDFGIDEIDEHGVTVYHPLFPHGDDGLLDDRAVDLTRAATTSLQAHIKSIVIDVTRPEGLVLIKIRSLDQGARSSNV